VDTSRTSLPSAPMVKIWSQPKGERVDWKTSRVPLRSQ
jgi:hypothetical protein